MDVDDVDDDVGRRTPRSSPRRHREDKHRCMDKNETLVQRQLRRDRERRLGVERERKWSRTHEVTSTRCSPVVAACAREVCTPDVYKEDEWEMVPDDVEVVDWRTWMRRVVSKMFSRM